MLSPDKELRPHVEASQNYRFLSPTQALLDQTFWMRDEVFLQAVLEQASRGFRCSLKFENHCSWAGRIKGRTGAKAGRCFSLLSRLRPCGRESRGVSPSSIYLGESELTFSQGRQQFFDLNFL